MATLETWNSREQTAKSRFVDHALQIRSLLEKAGIESDGPVDALTEATLEFGTCELRMRSSDRLQTLGVREDESEALRESAMKHHDRGLEALAAVRPFIDQLGAMKSDEKTLETWRRKSADIRADWIDQVSQLDVGGSDAGHLASTMDECLRAIDNDGLPGLGNYVGAQLAKLDTVRREEDRGTRSASFPWWKIVAAAAWLGITALAVWQLITYGAPWYNFVMVALIALIGTILIALGC